MDGAIDPLRPYRAPDVAPVGSRRERERKRAEAEERRRRERGSRRDGDDDTHAGDDAPSRREPDPDGTGGEIDLEA